VKLVVDASAIVTIVLNRPASDEINPILAQAEQIIAPDLLVPEVVNAIWKFHRFEKLDLTTCDEALLRFPELVNRLVPSVELYREAFLLSRGLLTPAYDMFYLALAFREDASILTLDKNIKKQALKHGIRVA
jgi:predicted nucleic acid-binding protein